MDQQTAYPEPLHEAIEKMIRMTGYALMCSLFLSTSFFGFWAMTQVEGWRHWTMALVGIAFFFNFILLYLETLQSKEGFPWVLLVILSAFFYLLI